MSAALELKGVEVRLAGRAVLEDVDLKVVPGEVVGVLGPNGAGKTTLLRAVLGLQAVSAGTVRLAGADPRSLKPAALAARVGYLPQEKRVAWNLAAWRVAALGAVDVPPRRARARALEALRKVGLAALAERGVLDMSGGERARVLLARLLATGAPLLLADEVTAGLDPDAQLMTLELLRSEARAGGAVLLTLHDLSLAARFCDRLLVLHEGRLAASGLPHEALTPLVLGQVFGLEGRIVRSPLGLVLVARRKRDAAA